jgi:hypothetical protein
MSLTLVSAPTSVKDTHGRTLGGRRKPSKCAMTNERAEDTIRDESHLALFAVTAPSSPST